MRKIKWCSKYELLQKNWWHFFYFECHILATSMRWWKKFSRIGFISFRYWEVILYSQYLNFNWRRKTTSSTTHFRKLIENALNKEIVWFISIEKLKMWMKHLYFPLTVSRYFLRIEKAVYRLINGELVKNIDFCHWLFPGVEDGLENWMEIKTVK